MLVSMSFQKRTYYGRGVTETVSNHQEEKSRIRSVYGEVIPEPQDTLI